MKKLSTLLFLLCALMLVNSFSQDTLQRGIIYPSKKVEANPSLSYSIYIPAVEKYSKRLAIFYFDPSGNGANPVTLYKNLADSLGIILIGNNNSRNGMDFNTIAQNFAAISSEVMHKYKIDNKDMCLWGFSGGAKAAMYCADNFDFYYTIYGGSVYSEMQKKIELLGINGTKDMNYTELLAYDISQQNNTNHLQIVWNGKHSWPDSLTASDAIKWFLFRKMQKNEIKWDSKLILKTNAVYAKEVNKLYQSKKYYKTYLSGKKTIIMLDKLINIQPIKNIIGKIVKSPQFMTEMKQVESQYKKETDLKNKYINAFSGSDSTYWKTETDKLYLQAKTDKNGIYDRILGFLSLAAYSLSTEALRTDNINNMPVVLALYRYADPSNPEHAFLSAKYAALKNNPEQAKSYMQTALNLGISRIRFEEDDLLKKIGK